MGIILGRRRLERVFIIDDDEFSRESFGLTVEETDMTPISQSTGISSLENYLRDFITSEDAIITDHHLKKRNYFPVNGAKVAFECYQRKIPSVLVTRYEQADINEIRKYRAQIPIVLKPDEFDPDSLIRSLEICINEFSGDVMSERIPWRTLIRIDDVVDNNIFVFILGWNSEVSISINIQDLPQEVQDIVGPDIHLHAMVNVGAENANDLFFTDWELK